MNIDFENTENAFDYKTDRQLNKALLLLKILNKPKLSQWLRNMALKFVNFKLPLFRWVFKQTIFNQFLGGENLNECEETAKVLREYGILTVLDYSVEGKKEEEDLDEAMEEFIRALEFAASQTGIPVVTIKISALADNELLMKWQKHELLSTQEFKRFQSVKKRVDEICELAADLNIRVFIDAEESWIQDTIDYLAKEMMHKYNQESITVYTTYQLYRKDRLTVLKKDYEEAKAKNYILGAKLVRGAYLEKERRRAREQGYPSPVHVTKADTDFDYNEALRFCSVHYDDIASCAATHNELSCQLQADEIAKLDVRNDHPHLNFCQLYGMSDHITFNLADAGYNAAKYLPYGPVHEVMPYLIRRLEENSAVEGEMSREFELLKIEKMRRKSLKKSAKESLPS